MGANGGVFNTNVFDVVYVEDKVPCVPLVVCTTARYWTVPLVVAEVSSHVVVVDVESVDMAMVVFAFHVAPASWVSVMTTCASVCTVGRTGSVNLIVPDEINAADNDTNGFGVVMMMFDTAEAVVPAAFDAFTTNVYLRFADAVYP